MVLYHAITHCQNPGTERGPGNRGEKGKEEENAEG